MYVCMSACMHACMHVCMHACTYVYVCMYACMYICIYVCVHGSICIYACMYVLACTHPHTRARAQPNSHDAVRRFLFIPRSTFASRQVVQAYMMHSMVLLTSASHMPRSAAAKRCSSAKLHIITRFANVCERPLSSCFFRTDNKSLQSRFHRTADLLDGNWYFKQHG